MALAVTVVTVEVPEVVEGVVAGDVPSFGIGHTGLSSSPMLYLIIDLFPDVLHVHCCAYTAHKKTLLSFMLLTIM